jgi:phospholipid/cholesterol/gamma-HCH transport system substrate-binding protein
VGEVDKIELYGDRAKVTVNIQKRVALKVGLPPQQGKTYRNGATLTKKSASLLGDYYLEITPGLQGEEIPADGQIMNVPETVGPDKLFEQLDKIAQDISKVTESLANTFGSEEGQQSLKDILGRLSNISQMLGEFLKKNSGNFDSIVANAKEITSDVKGMTGDTRSDLKGILSDVRRITGEVSYILRQSGGDFQEGLGSLRTTLVRFSGTLDQLNYTLQNMGEITDKINEGEGTLGVLVNDPAIATHTEEVIADVGDFVDRMVELRTIVELRSEYLVSQSALKNYIAVRLQPSPDKYYLIELVDDPRGRTSLLQTTTLQTDPDLPPVIREEQVITTDDFKFSIQIAKRWGPLTGRFGLIESSGGVGADLHLLGDALEMKMDAFDFGEDVFPRIRTSLAYTFLDYLYFIVGADDILNDETRDFFIGAALRFDDEDLKTILSSAPSPSFN